MIATGITPKTVEILLVEDNPGDVRLTSEALRETRLANHLSVVGDGEAALAFLRREGKYADAPRPSLILMDLNLPRKGGREVLQEIKQDPALMTIPVAILTTSRSEEDIARAYGLHANCYISKPLDMDEFIEILSGIVSFWFKVVTLCPAPAHGAGGVRP